jgi:Sulfotransferase family
MKRTVVLLLSDKRSGSTMVQRELCRHADIRHVEYSPHRYFETHHWLKAAVMLGCPGEEFSGGKVYPGYGSRTNAGIYLRDCVQGNLPEYQAPPDEREMVFDSWEKLCDKYAQPVFFEKSPQYLANWAALSLMLEWMERTEFDVKIIGLVRNPMSVQHSAQELFRTDPQERQFGWLEIYQNLLRLESRVSSSNYCLVRYEDLIESPAESFSRLLDFLELDPDPQIGGKVHSKSADNWSEDPGFDLQLAEPVKAIAMQFGYSGEDLYNPMKAGTSGPRKLYRDILWPYYRWVSRMRYRFIHPLLARMRIYRR